MTPVELQRALAQMPPRSAQTLIFRCVEGRSAAECAALYGIGLPQWEVLYFDAARAFAGHTEPLPDPERTALAQRLTRACEVVLDTGARFFIQRDTAALASGDPKLADAASGDPLISPLVALLRSLSEQREEVSKLLIETERAAAASPARKREGILRIVAVIVIVAVSLFVWQRERTTPPPPTQSHFPLPRPGVR